MIETEHSFPDAVVAIYTAPRAGAPMEPRTSVQVEMGGIVGDRYFQLPATEEEKEKGAGERVAHGTFSLKPGIKPHREFPDEYRGPTFVLDSDIEEINKALGEGGFEPLTAKDLRRAVVLSGINPALFHSMIENNIEFKIGEVKFRFTEICTPCTRPLKLLEKPDGSTLSEEEGQRVKDREKIIKKLEKVYFGGRTEVIEPGEVHTRTEDGSGSAFTV